MKSRNVTSQSFNFPQQQQQQQQQGGGMVATPQSSHIQVVYEPVEQSSSSPSQKKPADATNRPDIDATRNET